MKIKSCPFCGGSAQLVEVGDFWMVGCASRCAINPGGTFRHKSKAATAWNTRACDKEAALARFAPQPQKSLQERADTAWEQIQKERKSYDPAAVERLIEAAASAVKEAEAVFDGELGSDWADDFSVAFDIFRKFDAALDALRGEEGR